MLENDIPGNVTLPHFAIDHGNHAGAITLKNLIIFDRLPGSVGDDDLHFWAHELFHTGQYHFLGTETFTKRYLANELGFRPVGAIGNPLEVDADMFACRYYPNGTANYLPGGACPIPQPLRALERRKEFVGPVEATRQRLPPGRPVRG